MDKFIAFIIIAVILNIISSIAKASKKKPPDSSRDRTGTSFSGDSSRKRSPASQRGRTMGDKEVISLDEIYRRAREKAHIHVDSGEKEKASGIDQKNQSPSSQMERIQKLTREARLKREKKSPQRQYRESFESGGEKRSAQSRVSLDDLFRKATGKTEISKPAPADSAAVQKTRPGKYKTIGERIKIFDKKPSRMEIRKKKREQEARKIRRKRKEGYSLPLEMEQLNPWQKAIIMHEILQPPRGLRKKRKYHL